MQKPHRREGSNSVADFTPPWFNLFFFQIKVMPTFADTTLHEETRSSLGATNLQNEEEVEADSPTGW